MADAVIEAEIYGGEEDTHRPTPPMTSYESMLQL
jgi:hypothetical protein